MSRALLVAAALAAASAPSASAAQEVASADGAVLRALDKIAGQTTDIAIRSGESMAFGRLEIALGDCRYPVEDPTSEAYAHLAIAESGQPIFDGWMVASSPALSALDNPRYDVWVMRCASE